MTENDESKVKVGVREGRRAPKKKNGEGQAQYINNEGHRQRVMKDVLQRNQSSRLSLYIRVTTERDKNIKHH